MKKTMFCFLLAVILITPLIFLLPAALAVEYTFTPIKYPPFAYGINDYEEIVGSSGILDTAGNIIPINVPGALMTTSYGINNAGSIVGSYFDSTGDHGFLYTGGQYTPIDPPGSMNTVAYGINDSGTVVGTYIDSITRQRQGFIYARGNYTTIVAPGNFVYGTLFLGINNSGSIVGEVWDEQAFNTEHIASSGFIYTNGTFTLFNVPVLLSPGTYTFTEAHGINNAGIVVGDYYDGTTTRGFLYAGGQYTLIDVPGASYTEPLGSINNVGDFVVNADASGTPQVFLATPIPEGIAACNGITLSGNIMVDSYNSTKGSYASQVSGGHAGSDGNVQTLAADANITLSGNAAVYGNASATGSVITSGHAKVYGTTSQNQPVSVCDPLNVASIVEKNRPSGSPTSITLSGKQTQTLFAPNTFYLKGVSLSGQSMLTVNGTGNATMFIDGDLSIAGQASFNVSTGIILTIYITGNISMAGEGIVNQGLPTDLIIYASAEKGKQVAISGNAGLGSVLYAPFSNISVAGNAAIMGEVWGMTVAGSGNAGFHYDEATMLSGR